MWKSVGTCASTKTTKYEHRTYNLYILYWMTNNDSHRVIIWEIGGNKQKDKNCFQWFINEKRIVRALSFFLLHSCRTRFPFFGATQERNMRWGEEQKQKKKTRNRSNSLCFSLLSFKTARRHLHLLKNKMNRAQKTKKKKHGNEKNKSKQAKMDKREMYYTYRVRRTGTGDCDISWQRPWWSQVCVCVCFIFPFIKCP